jgi:hypothetical protein
MTDVLGADVSDPFVPPTLIVTSDQDDPNYLHNHTRSPTPDTPSTVSNGLENDQRDSRFYIPYDLRIFHPNTLFTTHESLERERAGISVNEVDPSEELRQALELEHWTCYWLSMRLHRAKQDNRELRVANTKLKRYIEELKSERDALREQLNDVAVEVAAIDTRGTEYSRSSILRSVLRSRVINRVSRVIRRAPSPLATSEIKLRNEEHSKED